MADVVNMRLAKQQDDASEIATLISPAALAQQLPLTADSRRFIAQSRSQINNIITGSDDRLLVVIGPCSIHDPVAAYDYAKQLKALSEQYQHQLLLVMRVYFEKPRTTVGWKGLINDPEMNMSFDINKGLHLARELLLRINRLNIACATEFLDPVTAQYTQDLISWGAIGARTTESQTHRELASSLPCAIGFKNSTEGNCQVAIDAMTSARNSHVFYAPDQLGQTCIHKSAGNRNSHVILRGGRQPNYHAADIARTCELLSKAQHQPRLMVDCSHDNAQRDHRNQLKVATAIAGQIAGGDDRIIGAMVESFLVAGRQSMQDIEHLVYGQSTTDPCIDIKQSALLLDTLANAVKQRRNLDGTLCKKQSKPVIYNGANTIAPPQGHGH